VRTKQTRRFVAHGEHYGLRTDDAELADRVVARLPPGWRPADTASEISIWYTLRRAGGEASARYRLAVGTDALIESADLPVVLDAFERHAELLAAERARDSLFVHAGVVAWRGRAIVVPGASGSGKTSLVRAFLSAGATYYSDEYARLDREGRVHPYARPLAIRHDSNVRVSHTAEELGSSTGTRPLPVGLILVTSYRPDARWRPRRLSAARAMIALMQHTVAARRSPEYSMPILKAAVTQATTIESERPDAAVVVNDIVRHWTTPSHSLLRI
jgi:hypothetical protein